MKPPRSRNSVTSRRLVVSRNLWRLSGAAEPQSSHVFAAVAIVANLILRFAFHMSPSAYQIPLLATLALGGIPLVFELLQKLLRREFGSDLLAGISIVTSVLLGEYLAGSIVVLMLSGGEALENYALRSASSVLRALAKRMPSIAHRKTDSEISDVALE